MATRLCIGALIAGPGLVLLAGCSASPFDYSSHQGPSGPHRLTVPQGSTPAPGSIYRDQEQEKSGFDQRQTTGGVVDSTPESFVRYALYHNPEVERAFQQWRAASERLPQVRSLPDPRLSVGFFLDEVETRVGPQQAKVGLQQTFPWIGKLRDREDAAAKGALAAWYQYQQAQLEVVEQTQIALYNLVYLDEATKITQENYALLESFEAVVRARYRVGAGSHPELIKVQVELGLLSDRLAGLEALRPSQVAGLNALLNRSPGASIEPGIRLANSVAKGDAQQAITLARVWSPVIQSIEERIERARINTKLAQKERYPDLTAGIDYIVTDEAANPGITESGDDPIMLSFGINLPIWSEKYDAQERESIAQRLSISRELDSATNQLGAQIHQAWFEHTDADRRVRLYEDSLIPKAQESLSASLAGFRTGDSEFLDLLDTQRTLLEFGVSLQRARADRGKALATLNRLVGRPLGTTGEPAATNTINQIHDEELP